ncbi:DUF11 domain-containing protein [Clostridium botulinum B str. Eklund 17B (NRP)]|nr:DUF11 domain-containing protein [Clostridium botulinum B str. Eklund 17B (NRP)]
MQIVNQARVNFEYKKSHSSPIVIETALSNRALTYIICPSLKIKKCVDKLSASIFDILTYECTIFNTGNSCIRKIIFRDLIPRGTRFIFNSMTLNGEKERCKTPNKGLYIEKIKQGECATISFNVLIVPTCDIKEIKNYATISYDSIYNVEKPPIRVCIRTNKVTTNLKTNLLKQTEVRNIVKIPESYNAKINIYKIATKVELLNTKVINGLKNNKVLVLCKINYEISYRKCSINYKVTWSSGFSKLIFVPEGIKYYDNDLLLKNIKVYIEDFNCILLSTNKLLIDSQILIKIGS